ncbi:tranport-associated late exocytosis protein [Rhizoctonia solani 123E]|uniref:Tranport-associated late exocytosis protein n=1 Tax=Rhizoctonia solani 123E TaxID=1423351 RepID=A0A074S6C9_9AGAM|nr:tranport-associated late exocytosis protein [Rhizoctonia solani 123E]
MSLSEDDLRNLVEAYEAKLSEVGPTAVSFNLALWSAVSIVTVLAFNILRPRNRVIYEPKAKYHEGDKSPPKINAGFFSWVSPLINVKEQELVEKIGLDAVTFLRFLRLLRWSFTGVAFVSVAGIGVFDYVYNLKNVNASDRNPLSMFTIENIHGQALYVHVAGAYVITLIILGSIWWHWREMVKLRLQWFRSSEYLESFYARTLMIVQVPKKLQSDTGLESLFSDMRMPYPTTSVHIGRRVGHLPEMIEYHNQAVRDLEQVLVKYLKGGKMGKKRPTITIGGFLGFGGTKKDAIDFYSQRIAKMERAVEEARSQIDTKKPENYGFASMAAVPFAHTVAQMLHRKHPKGTTVTLAPNPKDIIWSNLTKGEAALASSRTTGWLLIAAVCFFNTIPLLLISAIANLAAISEYVGFLGRWAENSPMTFSLASGILPPSISALFGFFFPIIMRKISEYQGAVTHSRLDRAVVARYFAFLIISQFFIFSLLGVGFQIVTEIQLIIGKHQNIKVILKSLHEIPERIQVTYIQQSSYWLTFFPMRGFLAVFDLAQLLSLVLVFIKTHLFGRTPRDIREWTKPPEFDFAVYYSNILFMAAVGLMYAPLAPLVALAAAIVFWLSSFVYKYQLMFVFVSKVESGGRLWNVVMNRLLVGVIFMNVIMTLTIGLQRGWTSYDWTSMLPPTVLTILFKIWMRMTLDKQFRHFVPEQDEIARTQVHKQDAKKGRLESRFGHPSLHTELFTPMVHSNMTHLLEQVYQGRMAKEQTRMEEYGGKKVAVSVLPSGLKFASVAEHELEMDTALYQRDRGELDWDTRSIASTAVLDDSPTTYKPKPAGYERYIKHGPHYSNESDIELTRLDSRDNAPLLNRPGMMREMSAPSMQASRSRQVDLGVPVPPEIYRQDSAYSQAPLMHRQDSQQAAPMMYHQTSNSEWSLPPSYREPSRDANMAGRGVFRG